MRPLLALLLLPSLCLAAEIPGYLARDSRVVFLGDSNTAGGDYVALVDAALRKALGEEAPEILNLGLSSETCTGLSEPDHPFLRPNVHNRLERVLSMARPDAVVACYGMNDGIYYPPDPERFAAYQEGIRSLVGRARASGAVVVLLTPQAFDPLPLAPRGKLLPAEAPKFSYLEVYENYDSVIGRYGEWVLSQTEGVERTIDIQGPLRDRLAEARRSDPGFSMAPDGVHYDRRGHRIMARAILESWGIAPTREGEDAELEDLCIQRARLLHAAWLSHVGHRRPLVRKGMPLGAAYAAAGLLEPRIGALAGR